MRKRIALSLSLAYLCYLCPLAQSIPIPSDPNHRHLTNTETVTLVREHNHLILTARDARSRIHRIPISAAFHKADSVKRGPDDKIIVVGRPSGGAARVIIVELSRDAVGDEFDCYLPSVSPNGRFIALVKWFPGHFVRKVEWHYMFYDVSKSAAQNRPPRLRLPDDVDVGMPLYPPGISNRPADNFNLDRAENFSASDSLFWSADSSKLVFADRCQGMLSVVMFQPRLRTLSVVEVPLAAFCSGGESLGCDPQMTAVDFDDKNARFSTVFKFAGSHSGAIQREFPYSEFRQLSMH